MRKLAYIIIGFLLASPLFAYALSTLHVDQGGTGVATFTSSQLLYGNGTNALTSVATTTLAGTGVLSVTNSPVVIGASGSVVSITGGTAGQVLAWLGGVPTWAATTTLSTISGLLNLATQVTGTLPILNGGTNATSQTTNGVNYFDGTSITSGTSLQWLNSAQQLLIGTTTAFDSNVGINVVGANQSNRIASITFAASANGGQFTGIKGRGTASAQAAVNADDTLVVLNGFGNTGSGFSATSNASFKTAAAENFSTTHNGTYAALSLTPVSGTVSQERARFTAGGALGLGTTTPWAKLSVAGNTNDTAGAPLFVISSSTQSATTTLFSVDNVGNINTQLGSGFVKSTGAGTNLSIDSTSYQPAGSYLSGYDAFTHGTQFGQSFSATSTLLHLTGAPYSLTASSTAWIDQLNVGSTTANNNGGMATSTFFGNVEVKGYIRDDTVTNTLVFNDALGDMTAYAGSNCSAGNAPTGINSAGTVQNCTAYQAAGSYLTSYDAWTHPQAGTSATTSQIIINAASSTIVGNLNITGNSTTTSATTTNLFATTASTTNFFSGSLFSDSNGVQFTRGTGTLSNGANNNVALVANTSVMTFTGPTGAYSVSGFANPKDGRMLDVYFNIAQPLTLSHDSSNSSAGNRLTLPGGVDHTYASAGLVRCQFIYDQSVGAGVGYWVNYGCTDGSVPNGNTMTTGVLGNGAAAAAVPSALATSTLYGAASTGGFVLQWSNAASGLVLAATSSSGGGTVTSITNGGGLDFSVSPIVGAGTITSQVGTSSVPTIGNLAYWTSAGTPSNLGTVATGTVSAGSSALTVTANRAAIGGALAIDCATASGSQNGCLSSTDWTTFNNKPPFEWTPTTNFSNNANATTTPIWLKNPVAGTISLMASSTSWFDQINVGSTTPNTMATSTFFGNVVVRNNASTTNLVVSSAGGTLANRCAQFAVDGTLSATSAVCNSGTVTAVSVATANGFAGSSSGGATPALTITTSITGLLKGNGTAISAAAYTDFPNVNANSVLGNKTNAAAAPTSLATSSELFTGTTGQNAFFSGTNSLMGTSSLFTDTNSFVGIGSTTPWAFFSINPNTSLGTKPMFAIGSSTSATSTFVILNNGNIGIGTTTPVAKLSLASSSIDVAEGSVATSSTSNVDWGISNNQLLNMGTGAMTITFSNQQIGQHLLLTVCNPTKAGSTAGALTWPDGSVIIWNNETAPVQTTTASKCDIYSFVDSRATGTPKVLGAQTAGF